MTGDFDHESVAPFYEQAERGQGKHKKRKHEECFHARGECGKERQERFLCADRSSLHETAESIS
jgi:hypothetical protein